MEFKPLQKDRLAHQCLIYLNLMVPNGDLNDHSCRRISYEYLLKEESLFWVGQFLAFLDFHQYGDEIVVGFVSGELRELVESDPVVTLLGDVCIVTQG